MTLIAAVAVLRIIAYVTMAGYCASRRRWWAWAVFCALTLTTYLYGFTAVSRLAVELIRTVVGMGLIFITLRRK